MQDRERVERVFEAACGRWPEVFEAAGMAPEHFERENRPCPLCGGRDRFSFFAKSRVDRGWWFCRGCGKGDGLDLIMKFRHVGFVEALVFVERFLGIESEYQKPARAKSSYRGSVPCKRDAVSLWEAALPVTPEDPVGRYLAARRIDGLGSSELKYLPNEGYWEPGKQGARGRITSRWPVMLARVSDDEGRIVTLHRTYLSEDGRKAPVAAPKKLLPGALRDGFVRLFPAGETLCLAEGIETALSVRRLTGLPVWAVISVVGFKRFDTLPEGVRELRIYADRDRSFAGEAGAYELASRLMRKHPGLVMSVRVPDAQGEDWNDVLMHEGS